MLFLNTHIHAVCKSMYTIKHLSENNYNTQLSNKQNQVRSAKRKKVQTLESRLVFRLLKTIF